MKNYIFYCLLAITSVAQGQIYGTIDSSFAVNGVLQRNVNGWDVITSVAVQTDGKIVSAGYTEKDYQSSFLVMRILPDGSPDPDFGTNGVAMAKISEFSNEANAVAIQSDGKIVIGGVTRPQENTNEDFALVRFMPDGTLDNSFHQDGKVTLHVGSVDEIQSIAVLPDGKILAAGNVRTNKTKFALARFLPDGTLDTGFGLNNGYTTTALGSSYDVCASMAVQSDGKIILAGSTVISGWPDIGLVRYNSNGTPDNSFGTNGIVSTAFSPTADIGLKVILQPDDKILVAGYSNNFQMEAELSLYRYLPNGTLDAGFNGTGKLRSKIGEIYSTANTVTVLPNGKILAAGYAQFDSTGMDFAMKQFNTNGSVDNTFGANGIVTVDLNGQPDGVSDILFLEDGKILAAGTGYSDDNDKTDLLILRYLSDLYVGVIDAPQPIAAPWIYPNPVSSDAIQVKFELRSTTETVFELYDTGGKLLATLQKGERTAGEQTEELFLPEALANGYYILNIRTDQGNAAVKIMLNKQ